jgi:penicillin-binding protein 2
VNEVNGRRRLAVIGVIVLALFGGLMTRLWFLQVTGGEQLAVAAQQNRDRFVQVPAVRGTIYDARGSILAESVPVATLTVDRQKLTSAARAKLERNLGGLLKIDAAAVDARIDNRNYPSFVPIPVARGVDLTAAVYVTEHREEFPAVAITRTAERRYPNRFQAADLLGYIGQISGEELAAHTGDGYQEIDTIGKTGIEQLFESELRGTPGKDKIEVDNHGRAVNVVELKQPTPGHDVHLTVDLATQAIAEESLAQGMEGARTLVDEHGNSFAANAGAAVVLDARSGSIVAMPSNPSFDPNDFIAGHGDKYINDPANPLIDRALSAYAPGSTFKTFSSIAMLQNGIRSPDETVEDQGCIQLGNENDLPRCNAGRTANGSVDLRRALTVSSDVYFYGVGNEFWRRYRDEGPHQNGDAVPDAQHPSGNGIQHTARTYGFGAVTGVGLGDQAGVIPDHEYRVKLNPNRSDAQIWRRGDSASLAVGQGDVLVTPLQLANAYAAFANGGTLYTPRLASEVTQSRTGLPANQVAPVLHTIDRQVIRTTALTREIRQPIYDGLDGVVTNAQGTASGAFSSYQGVKVIGKTGTAQHQPHQDTSWFAAITNPDNDPAQPQYVVVVMVEQGGFGANVAAPIARRIIDHLNDANQELGPVVIAPPAGNEQSF